MNVNGLKKIIFFKTIVLEAIYVPYGQGDADLCRMNSAEYVPNGKP